MKKLALAVLCVFCLSIFSAAADKDDNVILKASLSGLNETLGTGESPINTAASGSFKATIHPDGSIDFTLTFANLSANALVSHIHFGFPRTSGGVMIFLCGGGGQPACPAATSGTVTGTITTANVVGPTAQGVTAGDLVTALKLVGKGAGYVNVHDSVYPSGEIRGQVRVSRQDDDR